MKAYSAIRAVVHRGAKYFNYVSMACLAAIVLLMFGDVVARKFLSTSILGNYEIVQNVMLTLFACALGQTQINKSNICIDVVTSHLPTKAKDILSIITTLITLAFFVFCAYSNFVQASIVMSKKVTSTVLLFPLWPFNAIMGLGISVLAVVLIFDIFDMIIEVINLKNDTTSLDTAQTDKA